MIDDPTSKPLQCCLCGEEGHEESNCPIEQPHCTICNSPDNVEEVMMGEDGYNICSTCQHTPKEGILRQRMKFMWQSSEIGTLCKTHGGLMDDCEESGCVALTVDDVHPWPKEN